MVEELGLAMDGLEGAVGAGDVVFSPRRIPRTGRMEDISSESVVTTLGEPW